MKKFKQYESGNALLAIIILLMIIAIGVVVSNYVGPKKGWLSNLINPPAPQTIPITIKKERKEIIPTKKEEEKIIVEEEKKIETKKEIIKEEVKPKEPTFEERYEALYKKFRKKFKNPGVGKEYKVILGSKPPTRCIIGILKKYTPGKITIKSGKVTATYPINVVNKKSYPKLFPERAAQMLALSVLKKQIKTKALKDKKAKEAKKLALAAKNNPPSGKLPSPQGENNVAASHQDAKAVIIPPKASTPFKYDPTSTPSPENLKVPLKTFAQWIEMQQRKMHGKIATKIFAKQQGDKVVLYLQPSNLFKSQEYDFRYSVTNGMWQIWGFKCMDAGAVSSPEDAHIVLVDKKNKIIGGSTIKDASAIWVKRK